MTMLNLIHLITLDITDEYIVLAAVALLRSRCSICVVYTKTDLDVCALFISKTLDKQTIICYTIFVIKLLLL